MKPPICAICRKDFRDRMESGGLVTFADHEPLPEGLTGHPRGTFWFCQKHYEAASALQDLTSAEAFERLGSPIFRMVRVLRRLGHWLERLLDR